MPDQRIDQLNAETTPAAADVLPVFSIAGSDTKKITVKNLVQQGVALVDNASIPVAKVNLSGISGTNLTTGTVAASKLDTSTIPATGGVTVSSSNLQLVAPTSPIVRNAGTGSLEHANSGVTAGTYTKVTVDSKGHVTVGAAVAAADLPIAVAGTVGVMSPGTGLSVTGGGVLNHSSSVTAGTTSGFTYNAQGHITGAVALAGADLPISTSSVRGAVRPGTGLSVDGNGILDVTAATNAVLGGVIAGSDFSVSTGTISLAAQAGIAAGTYTKLTVNSKGIATAGTVLSAGDIPNIATSQITSGTLNIDRYGANTITGAKLANYSISKISDAFPTADYISQLYFSPLDRTLYMWDGNVYQPIGVSYGQVVFSGTYDAGTNLIASVTTEGAAIGLTVGGALVSPVTATKGHYVVVDQPGTGTAPAPTISLSPPDMLLSNGTTWVLLDVSDTVTAQLASNIQVSPAGNIASTNVQSALQELDDEKLPLAGGTLTGNLALNTGIAIVYEGATTDNFETTLYVVDPTADRTILLPNVSGTVVTTGDTGTVTSTMLLDGTILNEDINASAAIVDTKLATIATAGKVSNSATTAASANTASAIVARDASGNFTAGTITAALTGAASSNVLKAGDTMTGALVVPLASASTPSLTFTGDLNTGIYSPGADQVAVATNGTGRLFVDASGNVGVGAAPVVAFAGQTHLTVNHSSGGTTVAGINLATDGTRRASLITYPSNSEALRITAESATLPITVHTNGTERLRITSTGALNFIGAGTAGSTQAVSFNGSAPVNSMVLDSSGRLGIGTSGPDSPLHVSGNTNSTFNVNNTNASNGTHAVVAYKLTGDTSLSVFQQYSSGYTSAGINIANTALIYSNTPGGVNICGDNATSIFRVFTGGQNERLRITSAGLVGIGTTSPGSALHVVGTDIRFSNSVNTSFIGSISHDASTTGNNFYNCQDTGGHVFQLNGTEKTRIDSSGRLLVGTSSSRSWSGSSSQIQIEAAAAQATQSIIANSADSLGALLTLGKSRGTALASNTIVQSDDILGRIYFYGADGTQLINGAHITAQVDGTPGANDMPTRLVFSTTADGASSPTERMVIKQNGAVGIQATPGVYGGEGATLVLDGTGRTQTVFSNINGTSSATHYSFGNGNGVVGTITTSGTSTAYNTSSDYRLKENVTTVTDGITRLQQLKPSRFNFIADPVKTVDGFLAHEAAEVVPECVTGEKDAVDDDGNPVYQGIDQSKLVPLLTAALQEAIGEIESLKARVVALEAQ